MENVGSGEEALTGFAYGKIVNPTEPILGCNFDIKKTSLDTRIGGHKVYGFSGAIGHPTYISDQLQTRGRARLDYTFERDWVPSEKHQSASEQGMSDDVGIGNHNPPHESFLVRCLKFLAHRCRNVEYGKRAGDVEEQGSESELSAGTNPVIGCVATALGNVHHQVTVPIAYLLPDPNTLSSGSATELSSLPSLRNRSGS